MGFTCMGLYQRHEINYLSFNVAWQSETPQNTMTTLVYIKWMSVSLAAVTFMHFPRNSSKLTSLTCSCVIGVYSNWMTSI